VPGWLLSRRVGFPCAGSIPFLTHPARALTFSVAIVATIELSCAGFALSMNALIAALAVVCAVLTLLPAGSDNEAGSSEAPEPAADRAALAIFAAIAVLAVVLAGAGDNIARDRMWYSAWINSLATAEVLDWTEPFFGTDYIPARFIHNAWLATLGAITALSRIPRPNC
jgi:ribose/xylose/arabinose/galactoside ABC-type transport system permease subunit